jgi:hypothetical protein
MWRVRHLSATLLALTPRAPSFEPHHVGLPMSCGSEAVAVPKDSVFEVLSLVGGQVISLTLRPLLPDFKWKR